MPTVADIATMLGVTVRGDASRPITGVASLDQAGPGEISYLSSDAFIKQFNATRAAAVIVHRKVKLPAEAAAALLIVDNAEIAVAQVLNFFAPPVQHPPPGIDERARVAASAVVEFDAAVGPNVVIGERSRIGKRCKLHAGVTIGDDVIIGDDCQFFPNVVVRERITIGNRVVIHANSVLGSDGFGYVWDGAKHAKVPQIGTVVIEDDVEIGSCVCIDRAKFSETRVGRGTKIDNLVQVAHNVRIGPHCIITGQCGMAGSVTLGSGVMLGGQCAIRDQVSLGDGVMVAACSGVAEDVEPKTIVSGIPAIPHRQTLREQAALRRLPHLVVQLRKMQEEIEQIKKAAGAP